MPKILTVSIAAYQVEDYLADCLESFADTRLADKLEVLIINDGAGTDIDAIASEFVQNFPSIFRLITKENGGYGSTVNCGIKAAAGQYFKTVDGDDMVNTEALYSLIQFLENTSADLIVTNYEGFHPDGHILFRKDYTFPANKRKQLFSFAEVSDKISLTMHAAAFRTEILKNMPHCLDEHCFYVDAQYCLYPIPFVKTVAFCKETVYRYRLGLQTQSMEIHNMQKNCSHHETVLHSLLSFYKESASCLPAYRNYIAAGAARFATSQIKIYLSYSSHTQHLKEIKHLDSSLKKDFPEIYQKMKHPAIRLLRASQYRLYPFLSFACRKAYRC